MPHPGLHSLIVYDNFEWKTAQKSHENLLNICDLTKIPAISLEEYETDFYGVLKENYHRELNFRNLAKVDNLKLCILSDILAGKSVEKSYKDMSETFGTENIDDLNFFWNYRFYHECYGLDYDRKLDTKRKGFLNLPIEIHHKIIENLDVKNRFIVRKVSKYLRDVIDSQKIDYRGMLINFGQKSIRLKLNNSIFDYSEISHGDFYVKFKNFDIETTKIVDENFQKMALKDLGIVLKCAKSVGYLQVIFDRSSSRNPFELFLKVLENTKFDVERIYIKEERHGEALKIVSFFKPRTLEDIYLESFDNNANLNELVEMDQFKKAKEVNIEKYGILDSSLIHHFYGFDTFDLRLGDIRTEDVIRVQTALEKMPNDRNWTFHPRFLGFRVVERAINQSRVIEYREDDFGDFYKTKIPNSEYFISFLVEFDHFTMKKHR